VRTIQDSNLPDAAKELLIEVLRNGETKNKPVVSGQ
jgi:hypothetical protein